MAESILITALLPLTALMLVTQVNPYQALIIRGILGAIAALVYALLGAADVALTEALVGTMLSITLYAIAVRSSMSFRLGMVQPSTPETSLPETIATPLRQGLKKHHLRLEPVHYDSQAALTAAIANKEIHAAYHPQNHRSADELPSEISQDAVQPQLRVRLPQLHHLLKGELSPHLVQLALVSSSPDSSQLSEKHS